MMLADEREREAKMRIPLIFPELSPVQAMVLLLDGSLEIGAHLMTILS